MKFYGNGSVYIPGKKKFVRFVGGASEVIDETEKAFLLQAGYQHDSEPEQPVEINEKQALIEKARALGVDAKGTWGVARLQAEIERAENGNWATGRA